MPLRVSSPVVVGRADELSGLRSALDEALAGRPAVALVSGEAGVGKTRLVDELAAQAREAGARVLVGGCVELGGEGLPFAPVVDALRELTIELPPDELERVLGPARADLSRLLPELAAPGASPPDDAGAGEFARNRLFELLLGVLTRVAATRPLVLVVEDLHWADRSTLDLVAFLARSLRGSPVLLVLSYRSDEVDRRHPLRPVLAVLERMRQVLRVPLDRLDQDAVAAQLTGILGRAPEASLTADAYAWSQGNPFLVEEIVGLREKGSVASSLSTVLLDRVERLSDVGRQVVRVAAVAGSRVNHRLLAQVAGLAEDDLAAGLREAVEHHVLTVDEAGRGYEFRHVLTREAVYDEMLPGELTPLHRAYAEALSRDPGLAAGFPAAGEAYHWFAAHDLGRGLPASVLAARQAFAACAYAEAEQHARRSLEVWTALPDAAERAGIEHVDLLELASSAASLAGDDARGVAYLEQALAEVDETATSAADSFEKVAMLRARHAMLLWLSGRGDPTETLRAVADRVPAQPPSRARAMVLAVLARVLLGADPSGAVAFEAVTAARDAGCAREEVDALVSLGTALVQGSDVARGIDYLHEALDQARRQRFDDEAARAYINIADGLLSAGRYEEAVEVSRAGLEHDERVGLARARGAFQAGNLAESLIRLGRWTEAEAVVQESLALDAPGLPGANLHCNVAEIAACQGRADDFAAALAQVHRLSGSDRGPQYDLPLVYHQVLLDRGTAAAASGDGGLAAVLGQLDTLREWPRYAWPLLWVARRLAREAGEPPPDDEKLVDALPVPGAPSAAYRAMVLAEAADGEDAAARWQDAIGRWRALREPYPLAQCLVRLGEVLVSTRDREGATAALREAREIAAALPAGPLVDEADSVARRGRLTLATDDEPQDAVPLVEGLPALTKRELDVLRLVAEGRSNAQIATTLFISPKTVSVHITNLLAKLGVTNRREAAAVAYRVGLLTR